MPCPDPANEWAYKCEDGIYWKCMFCNAYAVEGHLSADKHKQRLAQPWGYVDKDMIPPAVWARQGGQQRTEPMSFAGGAGVARHTSQQPDPAVWAQQGGRQRTEPVAEDHWQQPHQQATMPSPPASGAPASSQSSAMAPPPGLSRASKREESQGRERVQVLALKAVQEVEDLQTQVRDLKEEVKDLKQEVQELKEMNLRLAVLEATVAHTTWK